MIHTRAAVRQISPWPPCRGRGWRTDWNAHNGGTRTYIRSSFTKLEVFAKPEYRSFFHRGKTPPGDIPQSKGRIFVLRRQ